MRLNEAFEMLKAEFPEALEVTHPEKINQMGLYLYFDGATPNDASKDNAHFMLLLVGATFSSVGDESIVHTLQNIRKKVFLLGIKNQENFFREIKTAVFEGNDLFMYTIKLEIKVTI